MHKIQKNTVARNLPRQRPNQQRNVKPQLSRTGVSSPSIHTHNVSAPEALPTRNGELSSPFSDPTLPDFDFYAAMSEDERREHMRQVLARDEDEALEVVLPVFKWFKSFAAVMRVYRPMIEELKVHFCRPGRPQQGRLTWAQIVEEHFGVSLRWMQRLLATPEETCETGADAKVSPAVPPPKRLDQVAQRRVTKIFEHAFQAITSPEEYAQRVERFMQGVVDRRAWDGYRVLVKVTVVKDSLQASHT